MKYLKYTSAALALIAAAGFTQSAKAQATAKTGDVILGVYDSAASGAAPNSYEVDLGAFSSLTAGETFTLGTSLANAFTSDTSASLVFDIAGTGFTTSGGGLSVGQFAVTAPVPYTVPGNTPTTTPDLNIVDEYGSFTSSSPVVATGTSSNGTSFTAITDPNTDSDSFEQSVNDNGGSYGISGTPTILTAYNVGSTATTDFLTEKNKAQPLADGIFELTGTGAGTELVFDPTSTPEPSTYALMLGGAVALWVVMRRRLNA